MDHVLPKVGDLILWHGKPARVQTAIIAGNSTYVTTADHDDGVVEIYAPSYRRLDPKEFHGPEWELLLSHNCRIGQSGTDPEIFAFDTSGQVVPSFTFLHSKQRAEEEFKAKHANFGGPIFWDGFQAEMAPWPNRCHETVISHIRKCLTDMASKLPPGAGLQTADCVEVPLEVLQAANPHFVEFGCSPSFNAYGPEVYPPIYFSDPYEHRLRYSGCHLHYSWDAHNLPETPSWFPNGTVVMMDKIAGVLLTAFGRGLEDPRRRAAYGRPGEYRLPGPRRLEYRTPGSYLLRNPRIFHFALDVGRLSLTLGLHKDGRNASWLGDEAHQIITACDADAACQYIKRHWDVFKSVMGKLYGASKAERALNLVMQGALSAGMVEGPLLPKWQVEDSRPKSFIAQLTGEPLR